ncbi:MAG: class I SAM-dependent methyltransferase [Thermomicrobiales bacterium]
MDAARYDSVADWYVTWVDSAPWVHRVILDHLADLVVGIPTRSRVLDLGCGEGIFSRVLDAAGYRVVGVDCSELLISRATSRSPETIAFVVDDAQTLDSQPSGAFDGVICVLALMDIPGLDAVFRAVRRVVHSGGVFSCVVMHPAFDGPGAHWLDDVAPAGRAMTRYLDEGEWRLSNADGVRGQVGAWHRTLGTYLNTAIASEWTLQTFEEWPGLLGETPNDDIPRLLFLRFQSLAAKAPDDVGASGYSD